MKRLVLGATGLAAAAAVVAAFLLHTDDSADRCFKEQGDTAIEACSRAIGSGRFEGADLAAIYDNRAIELRQRGDYDGAIADYSKALNIDAELTGAYAGRGLAYEGKAEVEKARADYLKALAIAPKYDDGQWAHDIARTRLAALTASS